MDRVAVVADIHGNLPALEAVMADINRRGIATVVNLGDHASGPLWPADTVRFLMRQPWTQIAGNHDRQIAHQPPAEHSFSDAYAYTELDAEQRAWLGSLPSTARPQPDLLLCHGTPDNDSQYLLETVACGAVHLAAPATITARLAGAEAALLFCGHSHVPRVVQMAGMTIVNPGSVGLPGYTDTTPEPHAVESGSPHARYAVLAQVDGVWHVELIAVTYDHLAAARRAERNGRPEWEIVLRTGFMRA